MGQIQSILRIEEGTSQTCEGRNRSNRPPRYQLWVEKGVARCGLHGSTVPPFHLAFVGFGALKRSNPSHRSYRFLFLLGYKSAKQPSKSQELVDTWVYLCVSMCISTVGSHCSHCVFGAMMYLGTRIPSNNISAVLVWMYVSWFIIKHVYIV